MKIAVIQFPGSNCERETKLALSRCGMQADDFLWNQNHEDVKNYHGFIIVGGFSYEDRIRSGIIAAMDPLMQSLAQQAQLGKPVLGICNGAQVLVESGLVPGLATKEKAIALAHNRRIQNGTILGTGFYNDWVHVKTNNTQHAFNAKLKDTDVLRIPAAHAEGRFLLEESLYQQLLASNAAIFHYCEPGGQINNEFPHNPNGSNYNLAAIGNTQGNIMAMMPHPERTTQGDAIFHSMKHYISQGYTAAQSSLDYQAPALTLEKATEQADNTLALTVGLNIHDNEAITLENALHLAGFTLRLKKYTHWCITHNASDNKALLKHIEDSLELYNPSKEYLNTNKPANNHKAVLVYEKDDSLAQSKLHNLKQHFNLNDIQQLTRAKLWVFEHSDADQLETEVKTLIEKKILANPLSQYCIEPLSL